MLHFRISISKLRRNNARITRKETGRSWKIQLQTMLKAGDLGPKSEVLEAVLRKLEILSD